MALYDDLVTDSQKGLFDFEGWVVTEGSDFRFQSDFYSLNDGTLMDFTVLTGVVARVYQASAEVSILNLVWEPHADGWFALTCSDASTGGLAGSYGEHKGKRPVKLTCYGDLPDGRRVQLVDATSLVYIAQKGPTS